MKHFINLKDIPAKDLRRILIDAKKRKKARKKLKNLDHDNGMPLKGKLLIQMFEKSSLRTRLSFYLAIKQLGGSTLTLRPDELHLSKGGESIEDTAKILSNFGDFKMKAFKQTTNGQLHLAIYKGEWKDGAFHGQGILREAWGGIYVGGFKNNLADGFGKQEEKDGTWWECEIKNDMCNGNGKISYPDGSSYEGEFKDMVYHGYGKYTDNLGAVSEGQFENFMLNGKGVFTNWNGAIYKGTFKDGFRDGLATATTIDKQGNEIRLTGIFNKDKLLIFPVKIISVQPFFTSSLAIFSNWPILSSIWVKSE